MLKYARIVWAVAAVTLLAPATAHAQLSRCLAEDGKQSPDAVIRSCNAIIDSKVEPWQNVTAAYGRRGKAHLDKGDHERALADYTWVIEATPRNAAAYNNRGIAFRAKGDNDRAIADYTKAIALDPDSASAYNNRGIAYRAIGENDRAIDDHTKALEIDPDSTSALNNRGIAYRAKGDNDRAIEDHTSALEIDPKLATAYYNRAIAYSAKDDMDGAIENATMAIEFNDQLAGAYHVRGLAYLAKGDAANALEDAVEAVALSPRYASLYEERGIAYRIPAKAEDPAPDAGSAPPAGVENVALTPPGAPPAAEPSPYSLVLRADLGTQRLTVIEKGAVVAEWAISSGLQGFATPTGTFQPKSANRMWYSRQYNWTPMPYAIFFVRGVAFHGTNATSRLGRSASHGCIRLATSNAAVLFDLVHKHGFAQTQIVVFGTAKHDAPAVARRTPPRSGTTTTAAVVLPTWARLLFGQ